MSIELGNKENPKDLRENTVAHRFDNNRPKNGGTQAGAAKKAKVSWLVVVVALAAGIAIGAFFARQHYKAQQALVAVNGEVISKDALFDRLDDLYGEQVMHQLVAEKLQLQFTKKVGMLPTQDDVNARWAEISKAPNFGIILAAAHTDAKEYKQHLLVQMAQENVFENGIQVSDDEVQKFYDVESNPKNPHAIFYQPALVSLQAIGASSMANAEAALSELNSQVSFAFVVSKYSVDTSRSNGGMLPTLAFGRSPLSRQPAVESQVFNAPIGSLVGPVFFDNKYWIFKVMNKAPVRQIPFSQVADQARDGARLVKGAAANGPDVARQFAAFQQSANLQAFQQEYEPSIKR